MGVFRVTSQHFQMASGLDSVLESVGEPLFEASIMLARLNAVKDNTFMRFLVGGAVNTVITYAVFLGLSLVAHYTIAYTITYLVGMIVSYWLAGAFVFDTGFDRASALRFPIAYIVQYLYGLAALFLLIDLLGVLHYAAILVVIATGIPLNFLVQRYAMTGGRTSPN